MDHLILLRLIERAVSEETGTIHEIEYLIVEDPDVQVIVFRATEIRNDFSIRDILRDFRFLPWRSEAGWGHAGFVRGSTAVCNAIGGLLSKEKPTICVGHSLGGALAVATGHILESRGYYVSDIVAFGAPRVFFRRKALKRGHTTLYDKGRDIVVRVPPWGKHTVKRTKIGKPAKLWPNFKDHSLKGYYKAYLKYTGKKNERS